MHQKLCPAITLTLLFVMPISARGHEKHPFITAIVSDRAVYVPKPIYGDVCRVFNLVTRTPGKDSLALDNEYYITSLEPRQLMRCKLKGNALWCTGSPVMQLPQVMRLPLHDLDIFHLNGIENRFEKLLKKYPKPDNGESRFLWGMEPINDYLLTTYLDAIQDMKKPTYTPSSHYFDIHPLKANCVRLFFLKVDRMEVWEANQAEFSEKFGQWNENWGKKPLRVHQAPFSEPFLVYSSGDLHFFVTKSGHIYTDKPSDDKKLNLAPFKTEEGRPVKAVITDAAAERTFVFGYEDAVKRDYLLELRDKPAYVYFDLKDIKPVKAPAPLDEALRYVQFLKDTKRIKEK
jgi:hypothetical protein